MKWLVALCLLIPPTACVAKTRYQNSQLHISFRYPRNFSLTEGDLDSNDIGLGYLGPIPTEFVGPGGVGVATVEAPKNLYPNTDLVNAFFTVNINGQIGREQCEQFPGNDGYPQDLVTRKIHRRIFRGLEIDGAGMGHQFSATYFHTFANNECYEFGYGIATAGYGAVDGLKQAPRKQIESKLQTILGSVRIK